MSNKADMFKLVFDYDTREEIQDKLNISSAVLRNTLTALRKKGLIVNNTIPRHYLDIDIEGGKNFTVGYKFLIQND